MGFAAAGDALTPMDALYPQKNGDTWAVRTQLIKQLADPRPYDLRGVSLSEYKGVRPPFDLWEHIASVCAVLSEHLSIRFAADLHADSAAENARAELYACKAAFDRGERPEVTPLPGLKS